VSSGRKQFKIYGPAHFRATWEKFLAICTRDGTNASKEIRIFVEGQVARRDPGNPQRTLGAYVSGHEDEVAMKRSDKLKGYIERAITTGGEIRYNLIRDDLKAAGVDPHMRKVLAESLATDLKKLGVTVVYESSRF